MTRESILAATIALHDELERLSSRDALTLASFASVFDLVRKQGASLLVSPKSLNHDPDSDEPVVDAFRANALAQILRIHDPVLSAAVLQKVLSLTNELDMPLAAESRRYDDLSARDQLIADTYRSWCYSDHASLSRYTTYGFIIEKYNAMFGAEAGAGEDFATRAAPMVGYVKSLPASARYYRGSDGVRNGMLCDLDRDVVAKIQEFNVAAAAEFERRQRNGVLIATFFQVREQRRQAFNPKLKGTLDSDRPPLEGDSECFRLFGRLPRAAFAEVLQLVGSRNAPGHKP